MLFYINEWIHKIIENGVKNMSFIIKDDRILAKYNETWSNIKKALGIKFHRMLFYDEKYLKSKVKEFNDVNKTNFLGAELSRKGVITLVFLYN